MDEEYDAIVLGTGLKVSLTLQFYFQLVTVALITNRIF